MKETDVDGTGKKSGSKPPHITNIKREISGNRDG